MGPEVSVRESHPWLSQWPPCPLLPRPPSQTLVRSSSWNVGREIEHVRGDLVREGACVLPCLRLPLAADGQASLAVRGVGIS